MKKDVEEREYHAKKLREKYDKYEVTYTGGNTFELAEVRAADGSINMFVRFYSSHGTLSMTGDAGYCMLNLPGSGIKEMAKRITEEEFDYDYTKSKIVAVEKHFWDAWSEDKAKTEAEEWIRSNQKDGQYDDWSYDLSPIEKFRNESEYMGCFESECTWSEWLSRYGKKYFGSEWYEYAPEFGREEPYLLTVIHEALRRVHTHLKED